MLRVEGVSGGYGTGPVLDGISFTALAGQVTCLMGRNGAGKTSLMRAIMGLLPQVTGAVWLGETRVSDLPAHQVPRHGLAYVPQGRRLFGPMTVAENLEVGLLASAEGPPAREAALDLFPRLRDRLDQVSQTLSGGEQQMLAIARALCLAPRVLLLDEPTEGLQPSMVGAIRAAVAALKARGVAVVLVEQRVDAVLALADRVGFLHHGQLAEVVDRADLRADAPQFRAYVGV